MALVDKLRVIEKRKIKNNFKSKYRRLNKVLIVKKIHVDEDQQSDVSDMYELEDVLDVNDED
jgi:hypothetical protein